MTFEEYRAQFYDWFVETYKVEPKDAPKDLLESAAITFKQEVNHD